MKGEAHMSHNDGRRARIQQAWDAAWDRGEVDALDELLSPDTAGSKVPVRNTT